MSDSDSDTPLSRCSSLPKTFKEVPGDRSFILKFVSGERSDKLEYVLKKGYPLPYYTEISGNLASF